MIFPTPERAQEIMGENFFGTEEASHFFRVVPSEPQLAALETVPWSERTLSACHATHVLVAFCCSNSILDYRERFPHLFRSQNWYEEEAFAFGRGGLTYWGLVQKEPPKNSFNCSWKEQLGMTRMPDSNESAGHIPHAGDLVHMLIGHFLKTGERLLEDTCVRSITHITFKRSYDQTQVHIGFFDVSGMAIGKSWNGHRHERVGLCLMRPPEKKGAFCEQPSRTRGFLN